MTAGAPQAAAVILAAGRSTRLGAFKPLVRLGGATLLARCVETFLDAGVSRVFAVAGHRADETLAEARRLGARGVPNPDFDRGMLSSVQAGVRAALEADPACGAALVLPADIPLVRPETVRALLNAWGGDRRRTLVPVHDGRPGHPVLVGADFFGIVLDWAGDHGLRGCLARHAPPERIAVDDPGILIDVDRPDDLRAVQALNDARRNLQADARPTRGPGGHA